MCRRGVENLFPKCCQAVKIGEKEQKIISLCFFLYESQEEIEIEQILIENFVIPMDIYSFYGYLQC